MPTLSPQQITDCTIILSQLEPGVVPLEIFTQIARVMRLPTVVLVPVRWMDEKLEVGLARRDAHDLWWPNLLCMTGTVLRSTDTMESALQRLLEDELHIVSNDQPVFRNFLVHDSERGADLQLIYSVENCEFKPDSPLQWFSLGNLPPDTAETEKPALFELQKSFMRA